MSFLYFIGIQLLNRPLFKTQSFILFILFSIISHTYLSLVYSSWMDELGGRGGGRGRGRGGRGGRGGEAARQGAHGDAQGLQGQGADGDARAPGDDPVPPLPPLPPLQVPEIVIVLDNLGFPPAIFMHIANVEGITQLRHLLILHSNVIDKIFSRLETANIPYTAIQFSLVKSLYNYVRRMAQLNIPINPVAINEDLLTQEVQYIDEAKAASSSTAQKSRVAFPDKLKDHNKWRAFKDVFVNYLYSIKGARNIPLSYVVRPDIIPLDADSEDPIYSTPLTGELYKSDNSEVFTILERLTLQGPGETYVKEHSKSRNGRAAFLQLNAIYDGASVITTKVNNAWKTLQETRYTGKRPNFDFQSYRSVLDEAFRDLEKCGSKQNDVNKIHFLLKRYGGRGIASDKEWCGQWCYNKR